MAQEDHEGELDVDHDELARAIGGLDPDVRRSFVADLYRARHWTVETTGNHGLVVRRPSGEERRVTIRHSRTNRSAHGGRPPPDVIVDPRRSPSEPVDDVVVVDADEIARQVRFALAPTDARRLLAKHGISPRNHRRGGTASTVTQRISALGPERSLQLAGFSLLVLALLVAGAVGMPAGPGSDDAIPSEEAGTGTVGPATPTALPVTAVPLSPETTDRATQRPGVEPIRRPNHEDRAVRTYCPDPPSDASPEALAPTVGPAAGRLVLEPWQFDTGASIDRFDPASAIVRELPDARWVGTYVSPGDNRYRVTIDRWRTPSTARRAYLGLDGHGHAVVVWGRYLVRVDGFSRSGGLLSAATATDEARILVAAVAVPGEDRTLGAGCATTLMGNPPP